MIKHHSDQVLEVNTPDTHDPDALEQELNTAEVIVRKRAMQDGQHGILITRQSHTTYIVAVCPDVPYGETLERCEIPDRR